jgi:YHS domain-containing protein
MEVRRVRAEREDMSRCAVCGTDVHRDDAPERTDHDGETYYFDSTACKEEFEDDPEQYA